MNPRPTKSAGSDMKPGALIVPHRRCAYSPRCRGTRLQPIPERRGAVCLSCGALYDAYDLEGLVKPFVLKLLGWLEA